MTRTAEFQNLIWACAIGAGLGGLCLISPLIPVALLVGGGAALAMLRKPILMCYVVVGAVVFLSGMQRGELVPLFIPNEPILVLVAGISYFVIIMREENPKLAKPVLTAIGIFTVGTALLPLAAYKLRDFPLSTSAIFSLLAPIQYIVILCLFAFLPKDETEKHNLLQWMLLCASGVALIGILEAMRVPFIQNLLTQLYPSIHLDVAEKFGRVTSVLGAWNALGNFLLINLILIFAMQSYRRSRLHNLNTVAALLLCTVCLLASGSYASLIGLVIALVIVKWYDRSNLRLLLGLGFIVTIAIVLLYPLISARLDYQFREGGLLPETLLYRFEVWQNVFLPVISRNPWFGVSPTFAGYTSWGWAESQYLYLVFRSGIVSLVAHLAFVFILIVWSHKRIRTAQSLDRKLAIALLGILVSFTIMGITNEVFTSSGAVEYIWIVLGLIAAEQVETRRAFTWNYAKWIPFKTKLGDNA